MEDLKEVLLEELQEKINKMKYYEEKKYNINDITTIINDRVEYDRLIGEKRNIELTLARIKNI